MGVYLEEKTEVREKEGDRGRDVHPGSMTVIKVGESLGGGGIWEIADDGGSDVKGGGNANGIEWESGGEPGKVFWDRRVGSGVSVAVVVVGGSFILHKMSMKEAWTEKVVPAKDTVGRV